jgi:cytochrome c556
MKRIALQLLVVVALAAPLAASAQMKPEEAIRARQSIMRVVALNFGPLAKMGSGDVALNKAVFQANAARVEAIWAMNPAQYFVPGTDKPVTGAKIATFSDARPEIWSQPDKFRVAAERASQQVGLLAQAARSGDEVAMRAAAGEVGKSCKACHDEFRAK